MNGPQLALIHDLMQAADAAGFPLWLGNGWAVEARLGAITREHDDVDLTLPRDRLDVFRALLRERGAASFEETDYGFLAQTGGVLVDCEPCEPSGDGWEVAGTPPGSCPLAREGTLDGEAVRCIAWPAILWDYFYYAQDVAPEQWDAKHRVDLRRTRDALGEAPYAQHKRAFSEAQGPLPASPLLD